MKIQAYSRLLASICVLALATTPSFAQTGADGEQTPVSAPAAASEMEARYQRAAIFANDTGSRFLLNGSVVPTWIGDEDRFWYCKQTEKGCSYVVVEAATGRSRPLFDHADLASKLVKKSGNVFPADDLQLSDFQVTKEGLITFTAFQKRYSYDRSKVLKEIGQVAVVPTVMAPDGKREAFIKDWNIWVRDLKSGEEKQVTTDGEEFYAYAMKPSASRNFHWAAELRWAPDSRRIFTVQTDDRQVKPMPFIAYARDEDVRPVAFSQRYALPGDAHVPMFRLAVIDTETGKQIPVRYSDLPATRMLDAPPQGGRAWWSGDGRRVFFIDIERGEKSARLISADAATGETRELFREDNPAGYVELSQDVYGATTTVPLPERNQVIWYSERSGVPQLYLFDLATGTLVRKLTDDSYVVRDILSVDERRGEALIAVSGKQEDKNPYYQEVMRINLDTGVGEVVSAGDDDRVVAPDGRFGMSLALLLAGARQGGGVAPSGNYWVETRSRIDRPGVTVIRSRSGADVATLETARLNGVPSGFRLPEPVLVTAADGETKLQALIARPSNFDPAKKYPLIDVIYGGPQASVVPSRLEGNALTALSLAELGFIAVVIDGRGTTGRTRKFREASYGAAETASNLEDHMAAIRELAGRHPYIDLDRVGITGFSGGGYMSTSAMLRYPDFFKVAVSGAGNHDQRDFWFSWGERYQGLLDGDNYMPQANLTYAKNLRGKLMLYHGLLDTGVQPGTMFNLVQKLEDANRDFDLVIAPRAPHTYTGYGQRRAWDYFVEHLGGETPPKEFKLVNSFDYSVAEAKRREASKDKAGAK